MAHRGSSGTRPENTMLAFEQAVEDGADILEMDVRMSLDGEVVVIHDKSLERTTNGTGAVSEIAYEALQELDAAYRFSTDAGVTFPFRAQGVKVPRFQEVLEAFPQMPINVEIKENNPALINKMNVILREYGRIQEGSVLVSAPRASVMKAFRAIAGDAITGSSRREGFRCVGSAWMRLPVLFRRPQGMALQVSARKMGIKIPTASVVKRAHELGLEVHVWTVNDVAQMQRLLDIGVDGIFTDYPALMRKVLNERK
jgi:glycerophosphoryl diester phosphodiesterase